MEQTKILLVEDDLFLNELYVGLLKNAGFSVDVSLDGEDAYNKIKSGGWDLVLLDVMLPKMDGFEIVKTIKKEMTTPPYKKLIFLTNLDREELLKQASELGDGYLIKSDLAPDMFLEKVKGYLVSSES